MSLRFKTLLVIGATILVVLLFFSVLAKFLILDGFAEMEREHTRRDTQRALGTLSSWLEDVHVFCGALAGSDWVAAMVNGGQEVATDAGLDDILLEKDLDFLLLEDAAGRLVWCRGFSGEGGTQGGGPPAEFLREMDGARTVAASGRLQAGCCGLVRLGNDVALFSARPAGGEAGRPGGVLAAARLVDSALIAELTKITGLSLSLLPAGDTGIPADVARSLGRAREKDLVVTRPVRGGMIAGFSLLRDLAGEPAVVLRTERQREILSQGRRSVDYFAAAVFLLSLAFMVVGMVIMDRLVLARLDLLIADVRRVRNDGDPSTRVSVVNSDELGALGIEINEMLEDIEQTHADLRESEERYSRFFHNNHAAMLLLDPASGAIADANPAACGFYNRSREDLQSTSLSDFTDAPLENFREQAHRAIIGLQKRFLGRHRHGSGEMREVEMHAGPVKVGQRILIYAILHDITERRRAERAAEEEREQLISIFDSIDEPVYVADPETYDVLYCNRKARESWGEMVGKKCYRALQNLDAPCGFCSNKYIFGENAKPVHIWEFRNKVNRRWYRCLDKAILWSDGRSVRCEIAFDINDFKTAEEGLRLNEARLEALLKLNGMIDASLDELTAFALQEGVRLTRSTKGYLAFLNQDETELKMHAWTVSEDEPCSVRNPTRHYRLEETGLWGEAVRRRRPVITNDYASPSEFKRGLPEGHVRVARHMNVPVLDGGKVVLLAGVGDKDEPYDEGDVLQLTLLMAGMWRLMQRKRSQEELHQTKEALEWQNRELMKLDKIKDGLIRDVSHELKTPVAKHAMQLELLKEILAQHGLLEETAEVIRVMESSVRRHESAIRNILDLSRLEEGGRKFESRPMRLDLLIDELVEDFGHSLRIHDFKVSSHVGPIELCSDREMLWHLLSNLINNAIKFKADVPPHRLEIRGEVEEGRIVSVVVSDNGRGMSEEVRSRVFERFFKGSSSQEGSGVGLSISRLIAEGLGGNIAVDSPGEGLGTTVTVRLPLRPPAGS